ncbi:MAG: permease [archaeon]|nr:MAG: permease [archaeon]
MKPKIALMRNACPSCEIKKPWYREKLFIVMAITVLLLFLGYSVPPMKPFFYAFLDYLGLIWWAILLGFVVGGIIDRFVPGEYITKYLAQSKKRAIFYATGLGFLMSACSHGILAISMELYKKGASVPSVIAFLLAAPWANFTITIMLIGFFGLRAFYLIASALVIAIITGMVYQLLDSKNLIEGGKGAEVKDFSVLQDMRKRVGRYSFSLDSVRRDAAGVLKGGWNLSKMVLWWILIGMLAASFARAFIPVEIFRSFLGPSLLGLFVTLIIATVIEVCSEGSSPIAFEIFHQTGAFGNSFVFLMAGVATDYTEIGLIWSNIGKKAALWLPIITVPQIVVLGYLFNLLL